jgi:formate C-acetyltransferase
MPMVVAASYSSTSAATGAEAGATCSPLISSRPPFDEVFEKFDVTMEWLARTYVHAMNCIHYMHDKYFYERLEMALHDRDILRTMAFGYRRSIGGGG